MNGKQTQLLDVSDLKVHFTVRRGLRARNPVKAVDGVTFSIAENESVGIIGESGCGKSSLSRAIVHLNEVTSGNVRFRGEEIVHPTQARLKELREEIQFVFQDPYSSLNPRMTVREILAEPLRAAGRWNRMTAKDVLIPLLEHVGLSDEIIDRYPHEFSGGQRQRISLARALVLKPQLVILDEPVSALDVSVQAQVLNLLMDLRREMDVAFVMISHDLEVVAHVADRVLVMYLGRIVESGPAQNVLKSPRHPYTKALISATPPAAPGARTERIILSGELPSPSSPPSGCRFRTRCWKATEVCARDEPVLQTDGESSFACHHPLDPKASDEAMVAAARDANDSHPSRS